MKLTLQQRHQIRVWLKLSKKRKERTCPFIESEWRDKCSALCPVMFPQLNERRNRMREHTACPCILYSNGYVVRVARLALARRGVIGKEGEYSEARIS